MIESIRDKVVIVTGGASGIGREIALSFSRFHAKVYVADIDENSAQETVKEAGEAGLYLRFLKTDVSDRMNVERLIGRVESDESRIDVVVNNAGINILKKITELEEEEWDRLMSINLKSVFLTAKYTLPGMIARKGGCFVNIGSVSGLAADYGFSVYNAAKAGMVNLTRNIAINYGIHGIRSNIVCPGAISTPLLEEAFNDNRSDDLRKLFNDANPMGRIGTTREVASAVVFLASDEASFINGEVLNVDGGIMSHTGQPRFN
jgi:NAD(P)-dependent dehydrogenase (short-subunit alcohol dehydrogenase family)